jgi:DNA-binding MarR family transcriptional regulator
MLLFGGFTAMVDEVVVELDRRGHPGVTASHEFALQAVNAGARNASELGRALGVSRQAAAKSITALEQLGYIERQSDPSDGRQKQLVVTDRGYDMVRIGAATFDKIRTRWSKQLGRAQLDVLESSLRALVTPEGEPTPSSS